MLTSIVLLWILYSLKAPLILFIIIGFRLALDVLEIFLSLLSKISAQNPEKSVDKAEQKEYNGDSLKVNLIRNNNSNKSSNSNDIS